MLLLCLGRPALKAVGAVWVVVAAASGTLPAALRWRASAATTASGPAAVAAAATPAAVAAAAATPAAATAPATATAALHVDGAYMEWLVVVRRCVRPARRICCEVARGLLRRCGAQRLEDRTGARRHGGKLVMVVMLLVVMMLEVRCVVLERWRRGMSGRWRLRLRRNELLPLRCSCVLEVLLWAVVVLMKELGAAQRHRAGRRFGALMLRRRWRHCPQSN